MLSPQKVLMLAKASVRDVARMESSSRGAVGFLIAGNFDNPPLGSPRPLGGKFEHLVEGTPDSTEETLWSLVRELQSTDDAKATNPRTLGKSSRGVALRVGDEDFLVVDGLLYSNLPFLLAIAVETGNMSNDQALELAGGHLMFGAYKRTSLIVRNIASSS